MQKISPKKQQLIDAKKESPIIVGERVSVLDIVLGGYSDREINCIVVSISKDGKVLKVNRTDRNYNEPVEIKIGDILSRAIGNVGANPFIKENDHIKSLAFTLESILFTINAFNEKRLDTGFDIDDIPIMEVNWNPFVYTENGEKQYYQRPFVWELKDKQNLIESIYQNIDCGKILVRKRGFEELRELVNKGETDLSFIDIVDGKQRLNTIISFINDVFPDVNGNYYSDLSTIAQNKLTDHQLLSYAEMGENTKDKDVINQFLRLNFTGVPQSIEHINFVKSLL